MPARRLALRLALAVLLSPLASGCATAQETAPPAAAIHLESYIEALRSDVRAKKASLLAGAMKLDEAEAAKFWPLQREYELELMRLNDETVRLIQDFGASYAAFDDAAAKALTSRVLNLEQKRLDLRRRTWERMSREISPRVAARFLQIERTIGHLIDLQIAANLPIVP